MAKIREKLAPLFEISEIGIVPLKPQGTLIAFASFIINGWFYCGGIGIHCDAASRGYRLTYPTKMLKNNQSVPLFHPINKSVANQIHAAVTAEWERLISN